MPEFKLRETVAINDLSNFPGTIETSSWLKKHRLPISNDDDLLFYTKNIAHFLGDNRLSTNNNVFYDLTQGKVDENFFRSSNTIYNGLVSPIDSNFGLYVEEYNQAPTLPLQMRSWINKTNNNAVTVNCQMPLILTKMILDRAGIEHHVRMSADLKKDNVGHPVLFLTGKGKYYKADFVAGGGQVKEVDKMTWDNRRTRESWAFLNDTLSVMRFVDYTTAMLSLLDELDKEMHGSLKQMEYMNHISNHFEEMASEFMPYEQLEKFFSLAFLQRRIGWE